MLSYYHDNYEATLESVHASILCVYHRICLSMLSPFFSHAHEAQWKLCFVPFHFYNLYFYANLYINLYAKFRYGIKIHQKIKHNHRKKKACLQCHWNFEIILVVFSLLLNLFYIFYWIFDSKHNWIWILVSTLQMRVHHSTVTVINTPLVYIY